MCIVHLLASIHSKSKENLSFSEFPLKFGGINENPAGCAVDEVDGVAEAETVNEVDDVMDGVAVLEGIGGVSDSRAIYIYHKILDSKILLQVVVCSNVHR